MKFKLWARKRSSRRRATSRAPQFQDLIGGLKISTPRKLFFAFLALWTVSLLWFGAVSPAAVSSFAAGTAILWILSVFVLPEPVQVSRTTVAFILAVAAVFAIQIAPVPVSWFPYTDSLRVRHGVSGSTSGTGDLFLTLRQGAQIGVYILAALFLKRLVQSGLRRWDLILGTVLILVLESFYAIAQVGFHFDNIPFYGMRPYPDAASGTLVNRNSFGGLMAMGLAFAVGAAWYRFTSNRLSRKGRFRAGIPWAIVAALFASCVVISKSRGGALAAAAGVLTIPFLVRRRVRATSVVGLVLIAALGGAAVYASNTDPLLERFEQIDPDNVLSNTRVVCWEATFEGWKRQPVLGFGIGTFPETFRPFQPPSLPGQYQHAHNEYVNALFEGGVAWLAVLVLGFATWLGFALFGLRKLEGSDRAAAAAFIAATMAIAIHSLLDFDLKITTVGLLFSGILGAALPVSTVTRSVPRMTAALASLVVAAFAIPLTFGELEPESAAVGASVKEPAEAEVALATILRRSPYNPVAVGCQALQAENRGDLPLAAVRLQTATDLWPANANLQRDAALWFLDHDDRPRATVCFRRYFEQSPSSIPETIGPKWSADDPIAPWEPCLPTPSTVGNFAMFLAKINRWHDAATVFDRGVPAEEKNVGLYDGLAEAFQIAGQWGLEAAIREKRLSIRSDPDAYAAAAAAWCRLEAWDKALEHARVAIRIDPSQPDWQMTLAKILDAKGDTIEATSALTEGLRTMPDNKLLRLLRAQYYLKEKLYLLSIEDFRILVKATPTDRDSTLGLARALGDTSQKLEALGVVSAWLETNPDDTEATKMRDEFRK